MDSVTILRALTVKSLSRTSHATHMIVQLIEPENKNYLISAGAAKDTQHSCSCSSRAPTALRLNIPALTACAPRPHRQASRRITSYASMR